MIGKELYEIAKKHIGMGGAKPRAYCGMKSGAWCNAYVCYVANEGGVKSLFFDGTKQTYCPTSIKWCKTHLAQIPLYLAMPMDIIYFDWNNNKVPDHIGFVKAKNTSDKIFTHEGNTNGGIVAEKIRPKKYVLGVFRPHFKPNVTTDKPLAVDGVFGYKSIAMLQKALGIKVDGILGRQTVKALQKKAGTSQDGAWGNGTSKKVQKLIGAKVDGDFAVNSVKKLQKWCNEKCFPKSTTLGDKLADEAVRIAWAEGTPEKKYKYSGGSPTLACREVMTKRGYTTKLSYSDCGYFQNSIIFSVLGTKVKILGSTKESFKAIEGFDIVFKGAKIPSGTLQRGDIIRYKKKSGQHTLMYIGDGRIAEAGRKTRFGRIIKSTKYNDSNVKHSTIQVLRAKEQKR